MPSLSDQGMAKYSNTGKDLAPGAKFKIESVGAGSIKETSQAHTIQHHFSFVYHMGCAIAPLKALFGSRVFAGIVGIIPTKF
jgi:hypothetical protein